jgi:hypothetical protein
MKALSENALRFARVLIAVLFVLNAIGIVDQTIPAKEMMERGVPAALVPWCIFAGRPLELGALFALVLGSRSVPTSCSAGASFILDSCDADFTFLL